MLADRIVNRNRDNLAYCKEHGIRLSATALLKKTEKRVEKQDARERNTIESKFGEGKRKYGFARIFAKLKETSECMIAMQFLEMNLEQKLRVLLFAQIFLRLFRQKFGIIFAG